MDYGTRNNFIRRKYYFLMTTLFEGYPLRLGENSPANFIYSFNSITFLFFAFGDHTFFYLPARINPASDVRILRTTPKWKATQFYNP